MAYPVTIWTYPKSKIDFVARFFEESAARGDPARWRYEQAPGKHNTVDVTRWRIVRDDCHIEIRHTGGHSNVRVLVED